MYKTFHQTTKFDQKWVVKFRFWQKLVQKPLFDGKYAGKD